MLKPVQVSSRDHRWVSSWCWSQYRCHHVITGEWVLDVEASTGVITWSQVSEFLMLKPIQVSSRAQSSEQSCNEDDDIILLTKSSAHNTWPPTSFLNFLYDVTCTESSVDVTGTISCINISGRNNDTIIIFIFSVWRSSLVFHFHSTHGTYPRGVISFTSAPRLRAINTKAVWFFNNNIIRSVLEMPTVQWRTQRKCWLFYGVRWHDASTISAQRSINVRPPSSSAL